MKTLTKTEFEEIFERFNEAAELLGIDLAVQQNDRLVKIMSNNYNWCLCKFLIKPDKLPLPKDTKIMVGQDIKYATGHMRWEYSEAEYYVHGQKTEAAILGSPTCFGPFTVISYPNEEVEAWKDTAIYVASNPDEFNVDRIYERCLKEVQRRNDERYGYERYKDGD